MRNCLIHQRPAVCQYQTILKARCMSRATWDKEIQASIPSTYLQCYKVLTNQLLSCRSHHLHGHHPHGNGDIGSNNPIQLRIASSSTTLTSESVCRVGTQLSYYAHFGRAARHSLTNRGQIPNKQYTHESRIISKSLLNDRLIANISQMASVMKGTSTNTQSSMRISVRTQLSQCCLLKAQYSLRHYKREQYLMWCRDS